jgi:hypothetical protein
MLFDERAEMMDETDVGLHTRISVGLMHKGETLEALRIMEFEAVKS